MNIKRNRKNKHVTINHYLDDLARNLLRKLDNHNPKSKELELIDSILSRVAIVHKLTLDHKLTVREKSCLYWAAMGKTSKETAKLLNVQPYTVEEYRKGIKRKLECSSMAEAVFKGIRFGLLQHATD